MNPRSRIKRKGLNKIRRRQNDASESTMRKQTQARPQCRAECQERELRVAGTAFERCRE